MKNIKKVLLIVALLLVVTTVTAFAASNYNTPAEEAAGVTERSVEDVITERSETDKTYGTIANDAGKLDEFKQKMLELKRERLNDKVKDGTLTQEQADDFLNTMEERQEFCNGTQERMGKSIGAGFGGMMGNGHGQGNFGRGRR
jgi:Spy/CpxP family protein refolding chaperone